MSNGTGFSFAPAHAARTPIRAGIMGPPGSGKTFGALKLARGIAGPNGRLAVIDTERGRSRHYSSMFAFDVCVMEAPFTPKRYMDALAAAWGAKYDVVIVDSLSHEWAGVGGILEDVDARKGRGNEFSAWKEPSAAHARLIETIVGAAGHIICTMRTKMAYELVTDKKTGKLIPQKIGMAPIAREGSEYEFDLTLDVDTSHRAIVSKCNTAWADRVGESLLADPFISEALGASLSKWIDEAPEAPPYVAPVAAPAPKSAPVRACAAPEFAELQAALKIAKPADVAAYLSGIVGHPVTGATITTEEAKAAARAIREEIRAEAASVGAQAPV